MKRHLQRASLLAACLAGSAIGAPPTKAPATLAVAPALRTPADVTFELGGPIRTQMDGVVTHWLLRAPDDNPAMLGMLRDRNTNPRQDLLPWSGEFAGKYLTGATQVLRVTHDVRLRDRLQRFVDDLIACQGSDGYLGSFPKKDQLTGYGPGFPKGGNWDAWNHYHAMVGLMLWSDLTGDTKALAAARRIGDLLCDTFDGPQRTVLAIGNPECNLAVAHSLTMLYRRTGEQKYVRQAREVVAEFTGPGAGDYLRGGLAGTDFYKLPNRGPRWESLHALMALPELYWITGDAQDRQAFENLWWSIDRTDRHNNGGFSSGEQAQGSPYHRGAIETCSTIAWLAMSVEMLHLTADSRVADELELSTLNQVVGMHAPDGAWSTYNTPMDGRREPNTKEIAFQIRPGSEGLNCCSVNAARGFGLISDWALERDQAGLVLNWYGASTMRTTIDGNGIELVQETEYPRAGTISLTVNPAQPATFALKLRVPQWSQHSTIAVNGQPVEAKPGNYAAIERTWSAGDRVEISLDLSPRVWVGEREYAGRASIYRGPLLLAMDGLDYHMPQFVGDFRGSASGWSSEQAGAAVEWDFSGDYVRWHGHRYDDGGKTRVIIDGQQVAIVDQYGPGRDLPFLWEKHGLGPGEHHLRLEVIGEKSPGSIGVWANGTGFEPELSLPSVDRDVVARATPRIVDQELLVDLANGGSTLHLREFGYAGANGRTYATWLPMSGLTPTPFSKKNPMRTAPLAQD